MLVGSVAHQPKNQLYTPSGAISTLMIITAGLRLGRPITILSLILGSALLCLVRFDTTQVGFFNDDAHYIVLAESLATGHGYHLINYPNFPLEPPSRRAGLCC